MSWPLKTLSISHKDTVEVIVIQCYATLLEWYFCIFYYVFLSVFHTEDKVSLCSPGCPENRSYEFDNPYNSDSLVMGTDVGQND